MINRKIKKDYSSLLRGIILAGIILLLFCFTTEQDSYQQPKINNTVSTVVITFKIDPPESGEIYCYEDEQKNPQEFSNKSITYTVGTELLCQVQTRNDYNFSSWSGLVSSSQHPITFSVLEDGNLTANLDKPFQIPSSSSQKTSSYPPEFLSFLVVLLILIIANSVLYYQRRKILSNYLKRIETTCEELKDNKEECLQRLQSIIDELTQLLEKRKIAEKYYDMIINKTLQKSEEITRIDTESKKEPLDSFNRVLSDLITIYENILPLFDADFRSIVKRSTMRKSLEGIFKNPFIYGGDITPYKRKNYVTYSYARRGYLSSLLFRRRIRKVLKNVREKAEDEDQQILEFSEEQKERLK